MKFGSTFFIRAVLSGAFATFLMTCSIPVEAQTPCPAGPGPGQRIIAVHNNVPLCVDEESRRAVGPSVDEWNNGVAELSKTVRSMSADDFRVYADVVGGINRAMGASNGLVRSAQTFRPGWKYFSKKDACSAIYYSPNGFVRIAGPTKAARLPSLTFHTAAIARPDQYQIVSATFENSNLGNGQKIKSTVKAVNWATNDRQAGFITLQVPTTDALLRGMADRMAFRLAVGGRTVADLQFDNGNEAKARLSKCLGAA